MTDTTHMDQMPCTVLRGVGAKLAETLSKRGIHSVQDVLFHLPLRYQDRTRITPIAALRHGDYAVIEGNITSSRVQFGKRRSLVCKLADASGSITLRFFHFNASQQEHLCTGAQLRCFGEARFAGKQGGLAMVHPEYRHLQKDTVVAVAETLTPIYPATEGLSQRSLMNLTDQAIALLDKGAVLTELLPENLRARFHMPSLADALRYVHRPPPDAAQDCLEEGLHPMQQRLAFEELVAHNIALRRLRARMQQAPAPVLKHHGTLIDRFMVNLPFALTGAQRRVCKEIQTDLTKSHPMLRLAQGDVGAGKTIVAAIALLTAVENNFQGALMAPTEILAEQHYKSFCAWLEPLGLKVIFLAGKATTKERNTALAAIESGEAHIIIGTHALFQSQVVFARLGIVVIDEQHRFGVHQRMALRDKGQNNGMQPHQLVMTATPIPRTLAMTAYADLDISIIDELPPGRTPVTTVVLPNDRRGEVIDKVHSACGEKRQVYWVCTLIDESEALQCQAAEATLAELQTSLPELRIALVHGRVKPAEKEAIMASFKAGDIDLLVATTVIEVGVDVPNASLMIIENPERLGLSQLHQLRGRVGRGSQASFCLLLYQAPLTNTAKARLQIMRETNDGFKIAQKDLEIRGPGEVLGTKQTGLMQLRIADIIRDKALLPQVQTAARDLLQHHPDTALALVARWIGEDEQYGRV